MPPLWLCRRRERERERERNMIRGTTWSYCVSQSSRNPINNGSPGGRGLQTPLMPNGRREKHAVRVRWQVDWVDRRCGRERERVMLGKLCLGEEEEEEEEEERERERERASGRSRS